MCAYYNPEGGEFIQVYCQLALEADIVCEFHKRNAEIINETEPDFRSNVFIKREDTVWNVSVVQCSSGHVTRDVLSCGIQGQCGAKESMTSCHSRSITVPMFVCESSQAALHYTLACDFIQHYEDNMDEDFCQFAPSPFSWFRCQNSQRITRDKLCDGIPNCYHGSNEFCPTQREIIEVITQQQALRNMNDKGWRLLSQVNLSGECSLTHFRCSQGLCLPICLRCNGVNDCPNHEDEAACDSYTCTGYYRCRGSQVCLHADHVCDGVFQCPRCDDELLCKKLICPEVCHCQGLAFVCAANFSASSYPALCYLDASGSGMLPIDLARNYFLIHLRVSECHINTLPTLELPNLRHLDLSRNDLTHIDTHHFHS